MVGDENGILVLKKFDQRCRTKPRSEGLLKSQESRRFTWSLDTSCDISGMSVGNFSQFSAHTAGIVTRGYCEVEILLNTQRLGNFCSYTSTIMAFRLLLGSEDKSFIDSSHPTVRWDKISFIFIQHYIHSWSSSEDTRQDSSSGWKKEMKKEKSRNSKGRNSGGRNPIKHQHHGSGLHG